MFQCTTSIIQQPGLLCLFHQVSVSAFFGLFCLLCLGCFTFTLCCCNDSSTNPYTSHFNVCFKTSNAVPVNWQMYKSQMLLQSTKPLYMKTHQFIIIDYKTKKKRLLHLQHNQSKDKCIVIDLSGVST